MDKIKAEFHALPDGTDETDGDKTGDDNQAEPQDLTQFVQNLLQQMVGGCFHSIYFFFFLF